MPLQPGTRLGPYEVTAQIGVGGMGEVYRVLAPLTVGDGTYPLARKTLTPHSAPSTGYKHYLGCNLLHRNVLTSRCQQSTAQAPGNQPSCRFRERDTMGLTILCFVAWNGPPLLVDVGPAHLKDLAPPLSRPEHQL